MVHGLMFSVSASIVIDAPREKVWEVMFDFPAYKDWYAYMLSPDKFLTEPPRCPFV